MAYLKVALFVAFACLVNAIPQVRKFEKENGWQQTGTILSQTSVKDSHLKQLAFVNVTVVTWNYTPASQQLLSDTVRQHLANIPTDSEVPHEGLRVYEGENAKLPMTFNMSVVEVMESGPKPVKGVAIELQVEVFAKKKHRSDILSALKNFSL